MITITPTVQMHDQAKQKQYLYTYTLPTVLASTTSDILKLNLIPHHGIINQLNVNCSSDDYDLSLFDDKDAVYNSVHEILAYERIDNNYERVKVALDYDNADTIKTDALYAKIKNDDPSNATGTITLKLYITDLR
jgi:hypothetical protein